MRHRRKVKHTLLQKKVPREHKARNEDFEMRVEELVVSMNQGQKTHWVLTESQGSKMRGTRVKAT